MEFFKKYNIEEYQNMSKEDLKNLVSLTLKYKKQRARKVKKFFTNIKWQINLSFNLKDLQYQYNTFSRNRLKELLEIDFNNICNLKKLKDLSLRRLKIVKIPIAINKLQNLEKLSLRKNNINIIPDEFLELENLKYLDLSKNSIQKLPDNFFAKLRNLEYLNLKSNQLETLPNGIEKLEKLKTLYLDKNKKLKLTDKEKLFCKHLLKCDKKFNLDTEIMVYNSTFLQTIKFEELWKWADENNIPDLEWRIVKLNKQNSKTMNNFKILTGLPRDKEKLINLKRLDLRYFNIKSLSSEIFKLEYLESLILKNNDLRNIPEEILNLKNLKYLSLNNNPFLRIRVDILNTLQNRGCKVLIDKKR